MGPWILWACGVAIGSFGSSDHAEVEAEPPQAAPQAFEHLTDDMRRVLMGLIEGGYYAEFGKFQSVTRMDVFDADVVDALIASDMVVDREDEFGSLEISVLLTSLRAECTFSVSNPVHLPSAPARKVNIRNLCKLELVSHLVHNCWSGVRAALKYLNLTATKSFGWTAW